MHNLCTPEDQVPGYVLIFLNKGAKFVPDYGKSSGVDFVMALHALEKQLHCAAYFGDSSERHFGASRFKAPSSWSPPTNEAVSSFMRLAMSEASSYHPKRHRSNFTWLDRCAAKWLRDNRLKYMVIEADKGLGDIIIEREKVIVHLDALLDIGFTPIAEERALHHQFHQQNRLGILVRQAESNGVLSHDAANYLRAALHCKAHGSFRLRLKLHKTPMGARPIANLTRSWIHPLAKMLCHYLRPMEKECKYVIASSKDIVHALPSCVSSNLELLTIDAFQLYEHIDPEHLLAAITLKLRQFYATSFGLASFLINLLDVVIHSQFVLHRGTVYQCKSAIATGLAPGVFLANLYLDCLDITLACLPNVISYRRLVDDAFLIIEQGSVDTIVQQANAYHPSIRWEVSGCGQSVDYFDTTISITADLELVWSTFRKPLNRYLYVPAQSCHPESTLKSIVSSEVSRMLVTNKHITGTRFQLEFFAQKLGKRGYDLSVIKRLIDNALHERPAPLRTKIVRNIFFKCQHASSLNLKRMRCSLNKYRSLLDLALQSDTNIVVCRSQQPNLFQRNYSNNWSHRTWDAAQQQGRGGS